MLLFRVEAQIDTTMPPEPDANLEDLIENVGGCGRFQIALSFIVHSMKCIVCFTMVAMVFGAAVPDWWCLDDVNERNVSDLISSQNTSQYKTCEPVNATKVCSKFRFADTMRTVVTEVRTVISQNYRTTKLHIIFIGRTIDLFARLVEPFEF